MQCNCRRGATVHFSCDEGYELQGSKSISCLRVTDSYVGWSDDRPICRGKAWHAVVRLCIIYEGSPHLTTPPPPVIFLYSGALIVICLLWNVLSFRVHGQFISSSLLYSLLAILFWLAWHWPLAGSFHSLLFSHASIVLHISHVYLTSDHFVTGRWTVQAPRMVYLMSMCSSVSGFCLCDLNYLK